MSICIHCGQDHADGLRACPRSGNSGKSQKSGQSVATAGQLTTKTLFGVAAAPLPVPRPANPGQAAPSTPRPPRAMEPSTKTLMGVPEGSLGKAAVAAPPVPRLPTAQEARANPGLVVSLDVAAPSTAGQNCGHVLGDEAPGRQGATSAHSRSYETEEQRSRPGWIGSQNLAGILTGGTRAVGPTPALGMPATAKMAHTIVMVPPATAEGPAPARATEAAEPSPGRGGPAAAPTVHIPHRLLGPRLALPQPLEETVRRTLPEGSRVLRDGKRVLGLLGWAARTYLHNPKAFLLLSLFFVLPASIAKSCLHTAALPSSDLAIRIGPNATVDFSTRKAELAARIQQSQARGQIDAKASAELAALATFEASQTTSALPPTLDGARWLWQRVGAFIQGFLLFGLAFPLALAALALAAMDQEGGAAVAGLSDLWPILVARARLYLITLVPAALLVGLGYALFVLPGLLASALLVFLPHVVLFEKRAGFSALARSVELARTEARRVLMAFACAALLGLLTACASELLFPSLGSRANVFIHFLFADLVMAAVLPIPALVLARIYLDLRARTGSLAERLSRAARS